MAELGIDKIEELMKEVLELTASIKKVMEDNKVDFTDAVNLMAAGKDGVDVALVIKPAYDQIRDLKGDEYARIGEAFVARAKEAGKLFGYEL